MAVAGILRDRMLFNMTEEEWDAVISVHLKGTFTVSKQPVLYSDNNEVEESLHSLQPLDCTEIQDRLTMAQLRMVSPVLLERLPGTLVAMVLR